MRMKFYYPSEGTVPVSVTGSYCALRCKHCNAVALKHMVNGAGEGRLYEIALEAKKNGKNSLLVSGGSDPRGQVPIHRYAGTLRRIRKEIGLAINAHVGLVREGLDSLDGAVDVVSLDIPASDRIIREIYGLDASLSDYLDAYVRLSERYSVVPHITSLLYYGRTTGEYVVMDRLHDLGAEKLIINVFMPLPGTPMRHIVPNIEEAVDVMSFARRYDWELVLGCMRPRSARLELAALDLGLDGIVMPSRKVEREVKGSRRPFCCALD